MAKKKTKMRVTEHSTLKGEHRAIEDRVRFWFDDDRWIEVYPSADGEWVEIYASGRMTDKDMVILPRVSNVVRVGLKTVS